MTTPASMPTPIPGFHGREAELALKLIREATMSDIEANVDFDDPESSELQIKASLQAAERIEAEGIVARLQEILERIGRMGRGNSISRAEGDETDA